MTTRSFRLLTAPVLAVALAATLTGCGSLLDSVLGDTPEPAQRDEPGGEITASAEADVFSLQLGDCFDYAALAESTEVTSVPAVPCADSHDAEIYAETVLTDDQFAVAESYGDTFCLDAFAGFVGKGYDESTLDYTFFYPNDESWAQGDDTIQCIVLHLEGGLTGTMRDTAL